MRREPEERAALCALLPSLCNPRHCPPGEGGISFNQVGVRLMGAGTFPTESTEVTLTHRLRRNIFSHNVIVFTGSLLFLVPLSLAIPPPRGPHISVIGFCHYCYLGVDQTSGGQGPPNFFWPNVPEKTEYSIHIWCRWAMRCDSEPPSTLGEYGAVWADREAAGGHEDRSEGLGGLPVRARGWLDALPRGGGEGGTGPRCSEGCWLDELCWFPPFPSRLC